jgi:hypothetical protein
MPPGPGRIPFGTTAGLPTRDDVLFYALLLAAILVASVWAARGSRFGRRVAPLMVVTVWYLAATLSVVSRSHSNYPLFLAPLGLVLACSWVRPAVGRIPGIALVATLLVLFAAFRPFDVFRNFAVRLGTIEIPRTYERLTAPPRVAGVLFRERDARVLELMSSLQRNGTLDPGSTWFDFANLPALYYVLGRDCPIRYYEVPFFQPAQRQREVIERLDTNRNVRVALVAARDSVEYSVDGVPNERRAPLVYAYLESRFRPIMSEGNLEVWARK